MALREHLSFSGHQHLLFFQANTTSYKQTPHRKASSPTSTRLCYRTMCIVWQIPCYYCGLLITIRRRPCQKLKRLWGGCRTPVKPAEDIRIFCRDCRGGHKSYRIELSPALYERLKRESQPLVAFGKPNDKRGYEAVSITVVQINR